jgi:drug/metabolite transporter (DMT)-like permease
MPAVRPSRLALAAAFGAVYLFWGSNFLAIRYAVETIPPFLLMGARAVIAGVCLLAWGILRGEYEVQPRQYGAAAVTGALLFVVGQGGLAWAQQRVPSGLAALVMTTIPLWMVLIEWRMAGSAPRRTTWLGLAIGFAGIALLVAPSNGTHPLVPGPMPVVVMVVSGFGWAFGSVASRRWMLPRSLSVATGLQLMAGSVLLCIVSWVSGEWAQPLHPSSRSLVAMVYMIVFASLVTLTAYLWLLRVSTPSLVGSYAFINPIIAVFVGWAFAGEIVTARMLAAAAVIVAGVALIVYPVGTRAGRAEARRYA